MESGKGILIAVVVIVLFALTYIIIQLTKKPASTSTAPAPSPGSSGGYSGGGSSGNNNPPPPPAPTSTDYTDFKIGDRVFAVLNVDASDRDVLGYHGYLAKTIKTFDPGSYIGTVSSVIPFDGLMVTNTSVANPGFGDPFFILGVNGAYKKG